jgi:hypothetical protein
MWGIRGVGAETGGVMFIIAGVAFALERFTSIEGVWRGLPLFGIYLAVRDLVDPRPGQPRSAVPVLSAVWLQISAVEILGFTFLNSWPLLVAFVGLGLVIDGIVKGALSAPSVPGRE